MTDLEIKQLLDRTGHWNYPFGEYNPLAGYLDLVDLRSPEARLRIESYQDFMRVPLEMITAEHHPYRRSAAPRIDGVIGPDTLRLLEMPRCGMPDYGPAMAEEEAVGAGAWKQCHGVGDFHGCSVQWTNSPPSWLAPLFPEVLRRVTEAYDEAGLRFYFTMPGESPAKTPVNIRASFVGSSSGWIGLALIGSRNIGCTDTSLWCQYLSTFTGGSDDESRIRQWTSLVKHELGHNCRYNHTSGGVMNPSIMNNQPTSWRNDVLWPSLAADFGGERVPGDTPPPPPGPPGIERVTIERNALGKYRLLGPWE